MQVLIIFSYSTLSYYYEVDKFNEEKVKSLVTCSQSLAAYTGIFTIAATIQNI